MNDNGPRAPGRPRDNTTAPALLEASRRLVIRDGYRKVSIQQIVDEAGVAKQTLYRRWSSKAELVLDAFLQSAGTVPVSLEGPVGEILRAFLVDLFENLRTDGPAIRSLIASAQDDQAFLAIFSRRFVRPRARVVSDIFRAAQKRGELPLEADIETATDVFHGAFWYRLLQDGPLDADFAARLAAFVLRGLRAGS